MLIGLPFKKNIHPYVNQKNGEKTKMIWNYKWGSKHDKKLFKNQKDIRGKVGEPCEILTL